MRTRHRCEQEFKNQFVYYHILRNLNLYLINLSMTQNIFIPENSEQKPEFVALHLIIEVFFVFFFFDQMILKDVLLLIKYKTSRFISQGQDERMR